MINYNEKLFNFNEEMVSRERQLQHLNQQLEEQEQIMAEIQQTNNSLQRQVEQLQQQQIQQSSHSPIVGSILLKWRDGGKAPFGTSRGAAVVDGDVAYFMGSIGCGCSYNSISKTWRTLPKHLYWHSSLAVIKGRLTAIGGCVNPFFNAQVTDKAFCLKESWVEVFPPMPTKRYMITAITAKEQLVGRLNHASEVLFLQWK